MKVIVVGAIAGGMSVASRLRRLSNDLEIVVIDKDDYIAYSNCALPYYLSGEVSGVFLDSKEGLEAKFDLDIRLNTELVSVDTSSKKIRLKKEGKTYEESYDKLVLSLGAKPVDFKIEGEDSIASSPLKTVGDLNRIDRTLKDGNFKHVLVLGGGFIGIEAAENLAKAGYKVSLVELKDQVLTNLDYDMVQVIEKEMVDKGINLELSKSLEKIENGEAVLSDGKRIPVDFLIKASGVRPQTDLLKDSGIDLDEDGFIITDLKYRTSQKSVYALGDAIKVYKKLENSYRPLQLAGPAQKAARSLANNIMGRNESYDPYVDAFAIRVFDLNVASCGLSVAKLKEMGVKNFDYSLVIPKDRVGIMPGAEDIFLKLIFEKPTGRILGAQAVSKGEACKRIDVVATAIKFEAKLDDLINLDLSYHPSYSSPKDPVNMAAIVGKNILDKDMFQVHLEDIRKIVEKGAYILDVRSKEEYDRGHIKGSHHIPLPDIRKRMDEVPKDKKIFIHCRSSQRSYYALTALRNEGYDKVFNLQGSFLGLSFYEYLDDKRFNRDPILTDYNFN